MAELERSNTHFRNRLSGEEAPTWLTAGFALVGTLIAGAAAWLALNAQPTPQRATGEGVQARSAMSSGTTPVEAALKSPRQETLVEHRPSSGVDAPVDAASSQGRPADAAPDAQSERIDPTARSSSQPVAKREECPPPVMIPFKRDSARPVIMDTQMPLQELRSFLNAHPQARVLIEGHADSFGGESHNLLLSYRRAKSVASLLFNSGLPEERMIVRAAGQEAPIPGLPASSGENRRVVLEVTGTEGCREARGATVQ